MPEWVTHMMVADKVLEALPQLDRHGFCVGNIAPDCNIQNEDWTVYTPPREVTHWMQGKRKAVSDVDAFCEKYIWKRRKELLEDIENHLSYKSNDVSGAQRRYSRELLALEEYSFLLGYYSHLITDAVFQEIIRDEKRVADAWVRIKADEELMRRLRELEKQETERKLEEPEEREAEQRLQGEIQNIQGMKGVRLPETWDTVKRLIPREERMREFHSLEAEYLQAHPDSGYFTDIMPLKEFPDYIDYLPPGSIAFKIPYLGSYLPEIYEEAKFIGFSREEFEGYIGRAVAMVLERFRRMGLVD